MPNHDSIKIDTVPLPERIKKIEIPMKVLREFEFDGKFIVKGDEPFPIGIILHDRFVEKLGIDLKNQFNLMIVPK